MPPTQSMTPVFYFTGAVCGLVILHGLFTDQPAMVVGAGIGTIISVFLGWFNEMA